MKCITCKALACPGQMLFNVSTKPSYMKPFNAPASSYPTICAAMNANQVQMNEVMETLQPRHVHRVAGAGNKFVHLATGKSDLYINFVPGLKLWDTCAGDALIKSRFGVFTDAFN